MESEHNKITLRTFEESDINNKINWINNSNNNEFLHYDLPLSHSKTLEWYKNKNNTLRLDYVIQYNNIPVGLIGLLNLDYINSKAEFYISMGKSEFKQKGIATKACHLLIDYAFMTLKLNKIYLTTDADNKIAQKLFEKLGFKQEGLLIKDLFHRGQYIDRIRYGLLTDYWREDD